MNIAVIVGVSDYSGNAVSNLPACLNDSEAVKKLIDSSQKFEDCLAISEELKSAPTKERLAEFINVI
ncbi:hypothetical protein ACFX5Q_17320 [Mesorhizobium sp. IMUNJ 23033]|uniref:hypothetical protein n=1 Tax=Mesorhizobium sp. IMUNJ 23033 TaxID=3378039 RepID=UPI00384F1FC8